MNLSSLIKQTLCGHIHPIREECSIRHSIQNRPLSLFLKYWLLIRRQRDCFYYKKPGRIVVHYVALRKRWGAAKPIAFVKTLEEHVVQPVEKLAGSSSFLTHGFVSLGSDPEIIPPYVNMVGFSNF